MLAGKPNFRWQSRQSRGAEAELHIFGNPGRDEMRKWTFTSLEVLVEKVRKRNLRSWQNRRLESWISHLCQSRQSGSVEAKLQIFRSPGRAEERKLNFISLTVKAGRKCRSGTSHLRKNWRSRSADRKSCHIMGSQGRAEMRKRNFTSLVVNAVWKRNLRSLAVTTEQKCGSGTSDL